MMKTNSDESLRVLLRLLIDEIVEGLSRSGSKNRSVQENGDNLHGPWLQSRRSRILLHTYFFRVAWRKVCRLLPNTVLQALPVIFSEPTV